MNQIETPKRDPSAAAPSNVVSPDDLACLRELERKVLWLSAWMIHNANHLRPSRDGVKVGGHQSSCASAATLMTALYYSVLRPDDRVAVKPHASPVFHAIQYLLGNQSLDKLKGFRSLGGAQSYPSRTKDTDDVDFSTGSVGMGVGATLFASLVQDYVRLHGLVPDDRPPGRMVAVLGDAELDEGNVFEALLEGWKHDVRNLWWVIDYNRQSLDGVVNDHLFKKINDFFGTVGWNVVTLKYGKRLQTAFTGPAGEALRQWIDDCPNQLYSALTFKGGSSWREHLKKDLTGTQGLKELLDGHDDASLHRLMTNLAGHDMEAVLEAYHTVADDTPQCFVAYTVKGYGLPLAGHKDNHAGLMTVDQMASFKANMGIADGQEWEPLAGLEKDGEALRTFLDAVPFKGRLKEAPRDPAIPVAAIAAPKGETMATQEAFGRILNDLGKGDGELARRILTTSPDVTVSTNLGGWVNQRGLFNRTDKPDTFRLENVPSALKWVMKPTGQHIELGIAENNLFLLLAAAGAFGTAFRRPARARRHPLRHLHRARPRRPELCLLSGRPVHGRGDSRRYRPGARGRRPPVRQYAADRSQPGRTHRFRARLRRRTGGRHGLGVRPHAARRWRFGLSPALDPRHRTAQASHDRGFAERYRRRRLLAAPAGARRRAGPGLCGHRRARGPRGPRANPRRHPRRRPPGRDLGRAATRGVDGGEQGADPG